MAEIEITTMTAAQRTGVKQNIAGIETITLVAAPSSVAADPDKTLTYIVSAGSEGTETITLALPTDPETKLGLRKKFFVKTVTNENDNPALDNTNLVNASGEQLDASHFNLSRANNWLEFELVFSHTDAFAWQILTYVNHGIRRIYSANVDLGASDVTGQGVALQAAANGARAYVFGGDSATTTGGAAGLQGGASDVGRGGNTEIGPGVGATDGGDHIITLPAGGSGRQGLVIVHNMPTSDPLLDDAWWNNGGVWTKSAGTPP